LMRLGRVWVGHHCDEYFGLRKLRVHVPLSSQTGSDVRRDTSAPNRLR
jgi:hypothetical protein